ncbi:hypothetical protein [Chondromyces crocatus]|uniref:Uncharacterized protein n=1 Tax=Chondromyces crocatus TaxID=52 RepID=A0A0K1EJX2_CHOCO|nr:hypothetical protein [Chondromyces crocatus]AKT40987.1 uncharacterized protein CMC5_051440 [Chondromyces crocatus]
MDKILEFQQSILNDPTARQALAANPAEYLKLRGIPVPAGTQLPNNIPLEKIENRVSEVKDRLSKRGIAVDFKATTRTDSQKVLSDVFKDELWGAKRAGAGPAALMRDAEQQLPGETATVAVMAAVVLVVVV